MGLLGTVRNHLSRFGATDVVGELALGHALRGVADTYNVCWKITGLWIPATAAA